MDRRCLEWISEWNGCTSCLSCLFPGSREAPSVGRYTTWLYSRLPTAVGLGRVARVGLEPTSVVKVVAATVQNSCPSTPTTRMSSWRLIKCVMMSRKTLLIKRMIKCFWFWKESKFALKVPRDWGHEWDWQGNHPNMILELDDEI